MEIPGYKIEQEIGKGSMASVYLAIQQNLDREVALKVMAASLVADSNFCERFLKEGKIIAKLSAHPHIVTVYDIGAVDNHYYMALEYAGAGNLSDRIRQGMAVRQAALVMCQIGSALGYAHSQGFVHRDVKPGNILFRSDDAALLSDFGIAKAVRGGTQMTAVGWTVGTPNYMSPEQATGRGVTPQSDLYSLGIALYEMLTGTRPYESDDPFALVYKHVHDPIPRLPGELAELQPVLDKLLAKDPSDRYGKAEELVTDLQERFASLGSAVSPTASIDGLLAPGSSGQRQVPDTGTVVIDTTPSAVPAIPQAAPTKAGGTRWWLFGSALVLAVTLGGGYYYFSHLQPSQTATAPTPLPQSVRGPVDFVDQELAELRAARDAYRDLLRLAPDSALASNNLAILLAGYEALAWELWRSGDRKRGLDLVEEGLLLAPKSAGLQELQRALMAQIDGTVSPQSQTARVTRLLARADAHLKAGRFTKPPGDNAVDAYREVLQIAPRNTEAQQRLARLATVFMQAARDEMGSGNLRQAVAYLEQGLLIYPRDPGLLSLRREAEATLATQ